MGMSGPERGQSLGEWVRELTSPSRVGGSQVASGMSVPALRSLTHDLVFSVTDADTVEWASGTLVLSDGTSYAIGASNTGNMTARSFIYFDRASSLTALQVTTTLATAVGDDKVLIATAINGTTEPEFVVYGGIGGLNINGSVIVPGTIGSSSLNLADRGWIQTCVFSATDLNTVAWASGSFIAADGTTYSIGAGNTGNMAAATYVYLDIAVSTTAYQTTTTASTSVGAGKVLIAVCQNGTDEPTWEVFVSGVGGTNLHANNIVASSITGNEIAASTITAGKLSVTQLSAITANMGDITSGTMAIGSGNSILKFNSTDGLFLGNASFSSAPFRVSLAGALTATSATITGAIDANSGTIGALTVDGTLTVGTGGLIQSSDYSADSAGFKISPTGGIEVNAGSIKGNAILNGGVAFSGMEVFTASGTWTRPTGVTKVWVRCVGGGGGGGGGGQASGGNSGGGGGGGGSGAYAEADIAVTGNVTVTVGAGGTAGSAGTTGNGGDGGAGGNSSFAGTSTITANGGGAGGGGVQGSGGFAGGGGGAGGTATGDDFELTFAGTAGTTPTGGAAPGGGGGAGAFSLMGYFGSGGTGGGTDADGTAGSNAIGYGAGGGGGGGGGGVGNTGNGAAGGTGVGGIVFVYY